MAIGLRSRYAGCAIGNTGLPSACAHTPRNFNIPRERVFTDYRACLEKTKPDLVILCPATGEHGLWTKRVAEYGVHIMVEKPFAATLAEADEMIAAQKATGKLLAINWPIRWSPCYITAKRLIDDGVIGEVLNVHHYGGNRGPLFHGADKVEHAPTAADYPDHVVRRTSFIAGTQSECDYLWSRSDKTVA